mmetsp:Transcript_7925/g.11435  ORF Transcript_7925/g.11435 Transcript_7925/m.11435 type:complete len:393 (-) Transcript_7925:197-1375(-)
MKFLLASLMAAVATASPMPIYSSKKVEMKDIKANSELGQKLMSKARKLEEADDEVDFTWVADFSLKFQGCHHISQWNDEADGEEDVRIQTKRLVRFRLCPSDACSASNAGGCSSGYGDYVIDMNTYLEAYFQSVEAYWENVCESLVEENGDCACENANDDEKCQYDCFVEKGVEEYCADGNPYEDDEAADVKFELEQYMECGNFELQNEDERKNRKLEEEEVEYFLGPYCAEQGGAIYLGMFTDDTCSTFADEYGGHQFYKSLTGEDLPYGQSNIIDMDCISCMEPKEADENNDGNDEQDEDEVREICENLYMNSGKCEANLDITYPNTNACNYMEGIKIIRKNGTVDPNAGGANKTASVFIGMFVVAFVLLGAYVYYLKTKLDRASINLAE